MPFLQANDFPRPVGNEPALEPIAICGMCKYFAELVSQSLFRACFSTQVLTFATFSLSNARESDFTLGFMATASEKGCGEYDESALV